MSATNPPLYFLATLKVQPGKTAELCEVMPRVVAIMEKSGWRLLGSWTNVVGRFNEVVDLWSMPEANTVMGGMMALMQHLDYPEIAKALAGCVEDETTQLMVRMPFDPGRI
jgi:hypothetical protein